MNQTNPPFPGATSTPKTSALAIWSLVLGILSFTCFSIISAIPSVICGHKALTRIKRSEGMLEGKGLATAGLVLGYSGIALAVFVLPLMMVIAIPNFVQARLKAQQNACINHLRMIDGAKQQWGLENKMNATNTPTFQDLAPYLGKLIKPGTSSVEKCPAGGTYRIGTLQEAPTCSIPVHSLD